ncbi:expressed unknown protein [Seminavis robusta]|uniref:Uncharacterized protein n=1 Tax=Seminavis robusta TaxID=568900 RepID=A0A9N8HU16_9STRA|nr:expressed unknown protein [Seminavis robusta]|eukprot:Sro1586_g284210.1 n/a (788) ;mRNA; f:16094-18457
MAGVDCYGYRQQQQQQQSQYDVNNMEYQYEYDDPSVGGGGTGMYDAYNPTEPEEVETGFFLDANDQPYYVDAEGTEYYPDAEIDPQEAQQFGLKFVTDANGLYYYQDVTLDPSEAALFKGVDRSIGPQPTSTSNSAAVVATPQPTAPEVQAQVQANDSSSVDDCQSHFTGSLSDPEDSRQSPDQPKTATNTNTNTQKGPKRNGERRNKLTPNACSNDNDTDHPTKIARSLPATTTKTPIQRAHSISNTSTASRLQTQQNSTPRAPATRSQSGSAARESRKMEARYAAYNQMTIDLDDDDDDHHHHDEEEFAMAVQREAERRMTPQSVPPQRGNQHRANIRSSAPTSHHQRDRSPLPNTGSQRNLLSDERSNKQRNHHSSSRPSDASTMSSGHESFKSLMSGADDASVATGRSSKASTTGLRRAGSNRVLLERMRISSRNCNTHDDDDVSLLDDDHQLEYEQQGEQPGYQPTSSRDIMRKYNRPALSRESSARSMKSNNNIGRPTLSRNHSNNSNSGRSLLSRESSARSVHSSRPGLTRQKSARRGGYGRSRADRLSQRNLMREQYSSAIERHQKAQDERKEQEEWEEELMMQEIERLQDLQIQRAKEAAQGSSVQQQLRINSLTQGTKNVAQQSMSGLATAAGVAAKVGLATTHLAAGATIMVGKTAATVGLATAKGTAGATMIVGKTAANVGLATAKGTAGATMIVGKTAATVGLATAKGTAGATKFVAKTAVNTTVGAFTAGPAKKHSGGHHARVNSCDDNKMEELTAHLGGIAAAYRENRATEL